MAKEMTNQGSFSVCQMSRTNVATARAGSAHNHSGVSHIEFRRLLFACMVQSSSPVATKIASADGR